MNQRILKIKILVEYRLSIHNRLFVEKNRFMLKNVGNVQYEQVLVDLTREKCYDLSRERTVFQFVSWGGIRMKSIEIVRGHLSKAIEAGSSKDIILNISRQLDDLILEKMKKQNQRYITKGQVRL